MKLHNLIYRKSEVYVMYTQYAVVRACVLIRLNTVNQHTNYQVQYLTVFVEMANILLLKKINKQKFLI